MHSVLRLIPILALAGVLGVHPPIMSAISPEAAEVQLQLASLLFTDGRFLEAFNAYEQVKTSEDPRVRRAALIGGVKTALRLGDFSHAHADAQLLARSAPGDAEAMAIYGDALWSIGLFEASEPKFQEALAVQKDIPGRCTAMHAVSPRATV